jgi:UDP-hydrolysing UDP-N-acetyl-D-glucosamine 2-epimerase
MRTIGVVTGARADYGIYIPLLKRIQADPELHLHLTITGMHLSPSHGSTFRMIEADGFTIDEKVDMLLASNTPEGMSKSIGMGVVGFSQLFSRVRPDILIVLGDRFEMIAAPLAALPFQIPVAHLHGGELTQGAIDDALRHAITKLSHLHFVSTDTYARRVIQMGESPWRVTVAGALSLDNLTEIPLLTAEALAAQFQIPLHPAPLLVTFHPVTQEQDQVAWQIEELLTALEQTALPVVFTLPNADSGGYLIAEQIKAFVTRHSFAYLVENFGTQAYFSMMRFASAMVGNSSSGIIEAASFQLPVVNIGTRQQGRVRGDNVIDVGYANEEIMSGIKKALAPEFHEKTKNLQNPYQAAYKASDIIVSVLKSIPLDDRLTTKVFNDQ